MKDLVSALSHLVGAILSIVGLVVLVYSAAVYASVLHVVSFSIYGASLILLYTASTIYHAIPVSERWNRILRKIDHSMIYVLIAGSYTPICLVALKGPWGWSLFGSIWGLTIVGILLKVVWLDAPRWLSTLIYTLMGWLVVIASVPLVRTLSWNGMFWLLGGGILYTIGAIIYGTKWPRIASKVFGFHEIFHIFILAGSFMHFWVMFRFILHLP
jgi:hemolysin III